MASSRSPHSTLSRVRHVRYGRCHGSPPFHREVVDEERRRRDVREPGLHEPIRVGEALQGPRLAVESDGEIAEEVEFVFRHRGRRGSVGSVRRAEPRAEQPRPALDGYRAQPDGQLEDLLDVVGGIGDPPELRHERFVVATLRSEGADTRCVLEALRQPSGVGGDDTDEQRERKEEMRPRGSPRPPASRGIRSRSSM